MTCKRQCVVWFGFVLGGVVTDSHLPDNFVRCIGDNDFHFRGKKIMAVIGMSVFTHYWVELTLRSRL